MERRALLHASRQRFGGDTILEEVADARHYLRSVAQVMPLGHHGRDVVDTAAHGEHAGAAVVIVAGEGRTSWPLALVQAVTGGRAPKPWSRGNTRA